MLQGGSKELTLAPPSVTVQNIRFGCFVWALQKVACRCALTPTALPCDELVVRGKCMAVWRAVGEWRGGSGEKSSLLLSSC